MSALEPQNVRIVKYMVYYTGMRNKSEKFSRDARLVVRLLSWIGSLTAAGFVIAYTVTALRRLIHPYQLTWMEGAVIDHTRWILAGNNLYGPPQVEFIPYLYTPLYYYACAIPMAIFGPGFVAARLITILSTAGIFILLWKMIRRETGSTHHALLGVGLFSAAYPLTAAYLDCARADALSLFLLFFGFYMLTYSATRREVLVSAVVCFLAVFTKQQALPIAALMALVILKKNQVSFMIFAGVFGGLTVTTVLLATIVSDGWFWNYIIGMPMSHGIDLSLKGRFVYDLLGPVPILLTLSVYFVIVGRSQPAAGGGSSRWYLVAFLLACLLASALSRLHKGGATNVLLPAYLALSLVGSLGLYRLGTPGPGWRKWAYVVSAALAIVQLGKLMYNPIDYWPTKAHIEANEQILSVMTEVDGPVYAPALGFIPAMAGKQTFAHRMAAIDLRRSEGERFQSAWDIYQHKVSRAISEQRFAGILVSFPKPSGARHPAGAKGFAATLEPALSRKYELVRSFHTPSSITVNGKVIREWHWYLPRRTQETR